MKKFKLLFIAAMAIFTFSSCEDEVEAPGTNYVTFESADYTFEVTPGGETTREVYVYSANKTSSARTFNVNILTEESTAESSIYSVPTSVTIPANTNKGALSVTVSDATDVLSYSSPQTLVLDLEPVSEVSTGEKITLNLLKECSDNKIFLSISFDSWPEEVYWQLVDDNAGAVFADPGPYSPYANPYSGFSGSFSTTLCVPSGDYTFYVYDDYGDGAGPVTLSDESGATLFSTSGAYGYGTSGSFTLP